jgi:hypothetical protein
MKKKESDIDTRQGSLLVYRFNYEMRWKFRIYVDLADKPADLRWTDWIGIDDGTLYDSLLDIRERASGFKAENQRIVR